MSLKEVRDSWDALGRLDPMWSILTDDISKIGNRWDNDEFFVTGEHEIAEVLERVGQTAPPLTFGSALDFGCGIGRLTRALAGRFDSVVGIDIAPSMIARADELNVHRERCRYVLNLSEDLRLFPDDSFDFIYSSIVLQHMPPPNAKKFIREFPRLLRPGGLLIFQLPDRPPRSASHFIQTTLAASLPWLPRFLIDAFRNVKYSGTDPEFIKQLPRVLMRTAGMSRSNVVSLVKHQNVTLITADNIKSPVPDWQNIRYIFAKTSPRESPRS